jgi:hypothetical protein
LFDGKNFNVNIRTVYNATGIGSNNNNSLCAFDNIIVSGKEKKRVVTSSKKNKERKFIYMITFPNMEICMCLEHKN